LPRSSSVKRSLIDAEHRELSIRRQCELLELERSTYYYEPATETAENLKLMRAIDELYLARPYFGSRRMGQELGVNRKRTQRLMRLMGLEAIYPKPRTTRRHPGQKIYPYLLRDVEICRPDQVWSTDITYIPLARGYLYLTAVLDWHSRYVLAWRLSTSLEGSFCCEALEQALSISQPEIFNTDQGVQFTSAAFTSRLEQRGIAISMDGRGRALDNAFIERLWRSVKYEEVYLQEYQSADDARDSLKRYWRFYNQARKHQSLEYRTPAEVYFGVKEKQSRSRERITSRAR
jgi:putative transposase